VACRDGLGGTRNSPLIRYVNKIGGNIDKSDRVKPGEELRGDVLSRHDVRPCQLPRLSVPGLMHLFLGWASHIPVWVSSLHGPSNANLNYAHVDTIMLLNMAVRSFIFLLQR
jgi:hypothetical protein